MFPPKSLKSIVEHNSPRHSEERKVGGPGEFTLPFKTIKIGGTYLIRAERGYVISILPVYFPSRTRYEEVKGAYT